MSINEEEDKAAEQEAEEEDPPKEEETKRKYNKGGRSRPKGNGSSQSGAKSNFKGETNAIKDHVFVFNQIHNKKWMTSRQKFINYAGKTYGGNEETSLELRELTVVTIKAPTIPTKEALAEMGDFEKEMAKDEYKADRKAYKDVIQKTSINLTKLFKVLWGQCDPIMKNKIKADKRFDNVQAQKSAIGLLEIVETVCEQGDVARNRRVQRFLAKKKVYNFRQSDDMDLGEYLEKFEILVHVAEKFGAKFYDHEDLKEAMGESDMTLTQVPSETETETNNDNTSTSESQKGKLWQDLSQETRESIKKSARDRALAIVFFMNANEAKYAVYKQECHNAMNKGRDEYPRDIISAHTQLEDFKFNPKLYQMRSNNNRQRYSGHQFTTTTGSANNTGDYICYNCDRKNQCMAYNCPHTTKENGEPTQNERKRIQRERRAETDGDQLLVEAMTEEELEEELNVSENGSWEDELEGDNYGITMHTDVLIEDLRGKSKHAFNQCTRRLNPRWVLLDNCSTVNVFYNKRFLQNIREASKVLHLYTNAGKAVITSVGDLPGFGEVYYYPNGIANILSFHSVTKLPGYTVEYHNGVEDAFKVTNPKGSTRKFVPSDRGLYYWDSSKEIERAAVLLEEGTEEEVVETIRGNKAKFSRRDNNKAVKARRLQNVTNWSDKDMMRVAKYGPLLNNPFAPRDISVMKAILGPSIPGLQGKTIRRGREEVPDELIPVPRQIMDFYQDIILSIDVMHVNDIPFMVTIAKHIHYGTANPMKDMQAETMMEVLSDLDKFYKKRGFKIHIMLSDKQFKCLQNELAELEINLNVAAQEEHVPEIERFIRVIKERARCALSNTPFTRIPKRMAIGLITGVMLYINGLPWEGGVSKMLSPLTIVTGRKLDYKLHCQVPFGAYAHVRRETDNTLRKRTLGAIALAPMNNMQGGMTFMNLRTGRELERDKPDYKILPMPDEVIDRVHELAGTKNQDVTFTNRNKTEILDIEEEYDSDDDSDYEYQSESDSENENDDDHLEDESTGVPAEDDTNDMEVNDGDNIENTGVDVDEIMNNLEEDGDVIEFAHPDGDTSEGSDDSEEDDESSDDESTEPRPTRSNQGQPYSWPGFEDAFTHVSTSGNPEDDSVIGLTCGNEQYNCHRSMSFLSQSDQRTRDKISHYVMNQYGLKAGLKHFGEEGKAATTKEMKQMLSREVFEEVDYTSLSNEDKKLALPILLFLTRKRDGTVKGRACADGRKQRIWMNKEDTRSPTVATEALFYLIMMYAHEGRDVATLDLPGHFLQTPMEGRLILRLDGELALALVELDKPRWGKYIKKVRGRWVIFVKCSKAIYGTLNAALLSYKKLVGHLEEWGYEMNPYDPCVWNKDIKGKQMTVAFHVDDMMISHVDPKHVDDLIDKLKSIYGKTDPMTVKRGKDHEYLGMSIDFSVPGEVRVTMYDYIQKMLNGLPDDMIGAKTTAAPEHLFRTDETENVGKLDRETTDFFHTTTAQALYLGKRARPDLQTAVAFLCTRVREPDEHDYKKLSHLMKYLQATKHLPLILRYDGGQVSLYIDGAHAVHSDMRGHAGVMVTAGRGTLYASSTKTKLNTTSSTETEIVAVGEKLPKHLWFRYFRLAQGGNSTEDVLYQDNEAAMLLENNGRMSCGKGSKHIHIRYFFVTDRIKKKEIKVMHCPTKEMIADYYTKPLQGGLFRKFRDLVLGIDNNRMNEYKQQYAKTIAKFGLASTTADHTSEASPQECVGN